MIKERKESKKHKNSNREKSEETKKLIIKERKE